MDLYFGIDVSLDELVSGNLDRGVEKTPNRAKEIDAFLGTLPEGAILGIESTGGYGELLANRALKAGFVVYILRPDRIKNFRKAGPVRSKTDALDAMVIRDYLETWIKKLHPYSPLPALEAKVRRLSRTRDKIVQKMADLKKALRSLGDTASNIKAALDPLAERIAKCDHDLAELISQAEDAKVLFSIPSVKLVVIANVLPALRTIKFKSKYSTDSYFGMDLKANESGKMVGRRHMSKEGDKRVRKALFQAAVSAARSKAFRDYYKMLIEVKKLKPIQALNALARKILHIIYGVYRTQTPFKAQTYS
jgi:transposase